MSELDALTALHSWCSAPNEAPGLSEDVRCAHIEYFKFSGSPVWKGLCFYRPPLTVDEQQERERQFRHGLVTNDMFARTDSSAMFIGWAVVGCNGQPCPDEQWLKVEIPITLDLLAEPAQVLKGGPVDIHLYPMSPKPEGWPPAGNVTSDGEYNSNLIWPSADYPSIHAAEDRKANFTKGEVSTYVDRGVTHSMGRGEFNLDNGWTLSYRLTTAGLRSLRCRINTAVPDTARSSCST